MSTEYQITYSIQHRQSEDDDWKEVGFGTSGVCEDLTEAADALTIERVIADRAWETEPGMPDPDDLLLHADAIERLI